MNSLVASSLQSRDKLQRLSFDARNLQRWSGEELGCLKEIIDFCLPGTHSSQSDSLTVFPMLISYTWSALKYRKYDKKKREPICWLELNSSSDQKKTVQRSLTVRLCAIVWELGVIPSRIVFQPLSIQHSIRRTSLKDHFATRLFFLLGCLCSARGEVRLGNVVDRM